MMYLFSLITCLIIIKTIFSIENEYNSNLINITEQIQYLKQNNTKTFFDCLALYFNLLEIEKSNFYNLTICTLESSKDNIQNLVDAFSAIKNFIPKISTDPGKTELRIVIKVLNNSISNGLIDDIQYFIQNNTGVIDNLLILMEEFHAGKNNLNYSNVFQNIHKISKCNGTELLLYKFYNASSSNFFDFVDIIFKSNSELAKIFKLFRRKLDFTRVTSVINLFFNIFKNYYDKMAIIDIVANFFKENTDISENLKDIFKDPAMIYVYQDLIVIKDKILSEIKDIIFKNDDSIELFCDIIQNVTLIDLAANLSKNLDNDEYLKEYLPIFISGLILKNSSHSEYITKLILPLFIQINKLKELSDISWTSLQHKIGEIFLNNNVTSYNISKGCLDLFNYTFFNYKKQEKDLFLLYFQKFFLDSGNSKGNFLTFDNCLNEYNRSIRPDNDYIIYPAFIIGIIDENRFLKKSKNSSLYYKYNFVRSHCFPYGYKNKKDKDNNIPICNKYDYDAIFTFIINSLSNLTDISVNTFFLHEDNRSPTSKENIYGLIGLLILAIPLIIYFILLLVKNIIIKKRKRINIINEITSDKTKNIKRSKGEGNKNEFRTKMIYPKCFQYLNEIFNIFKNGKELFNFSLNSINYNNIKGMTYIKGLIGISVIFTIFGQTFIVLANLPSRVYGIWDYYKIMKNYAYLFFYMGYRYSPRILFSCSGYTLVYKYLCYIEQEQGFYFLKFVFLQSYKYILLLLSVFFIKYAIYYINILIRQTKRPIWEIFQYYIDKESKNFFLKFFSFLFSLKEDGYEIKQNLIFYYYMPINEIGFFFLGTILISVGFKYKLRIDIFILSLIIIIYFAKIIIFFVFWYPEGYLSTTDYYPIDYGLYLINPIFNITCFLIGMYFGLINYSIQKGINKLYKENNSYNDFLFKLSESERKKKEEKKFNKDIMSKTLTKKELKDLFNLSPIINEIDTDDNFSENNNIYEIELKKINTRNRYNSLANINETNELYNENLDPVIEDENISNDLENREYSDKIKQMPFLISPIKFSNFHRNNKNKSFFILLILIAFIIILFFIMVLKIFIHTKLDIDENIQDKNIVSKLSFESILPDLALNIFYSIDIDIVVFFFQWGTFLLYFKQVEIIRSFLNHNYWSFFVKTYFIYIILSPTIILFVFYQTETVIKLNIYNLILYGFIFLILNFIGLIIAYSCYELPIKKVFKYFLKGKEILYTEDDEDDEEKEESDNDDIEENKILIDNN